MKKWIVKEDQNIADVMVEVYGKNEEDIFHNILEAFTNIITEVEKIKPVKEISLKITGEDLDELIFNFIEQLIYLKDTKQMLFSAGSFQVMFTKNGYTLFVGLKGQKITKNLPIKIDIKALTYHKFKVEKKDHEYKITLVFDI